MLKHFAEFELFVVVVVVVFASIQCQNKFFFFSPLTVEKQVNIRKEMLLQATNTILNEKRKQERIEKKN